MTWGLSEKSEDVFLHKDRQKLLQSLMRKGYGYSDINHVIRHLDELEEDTLWN